MIRTLFLIIMLGLPGLANAVEPDEMLADPNLEARAREISRELRCVVCQNQDIDSSNAGVARDLRLLVRERLTTGDSNEAVIDFVRARYGDFVLFKPPFKPQTYALWIAPFALPAAAFAIGGILLWRARRRASVEALSDEEEALVAQVLARHGRGDEK
ncbi:cytochrome c-type biogenesis protein CcmH [Psychromarinibacter sp. C21-152]|uniref:Cytochrome c-type biogenesis protein n=1 Tax=Psychromarinibacter sediminicola TaxID=3033385 RepID=A0AAE3NSD6_9RHOB|nr:cytochrome c-type biogenesis protein [Psychromarinibacter sediminicola]MDF0603408.1 cytochrome c-type biogenesis protein CcmH [Psychromarinibacter sediminicola]